MVVVRLDHEDSWLRCRRPGCGKLMALLVGGLDDRPSDVHWCLSCDPPPEAVWNKQASTVGEGSR